MRSLPDFREWMPPQAGWAKWLEKISLAVERPVNKFSGTARLNPFYHTGTISFFLFMVVAVTGFYLYIFFQYGFDASYTAVARLEGMFIGRFVRALHRYASGALVITVLLHALRMLFMERFRGPRWLAWLTGVVMTVLLWGAGVTGYWLIGDERAQLINEAFVGFLETFTSYAPGLTNWLLAAETNDRSWVLFMILVWAHIGLFAAVGGFFILHIQRLKEAKWMPAAHWVTGMGAVLVVGSLFFPVSMLPQADPNLWPEFITYDPIFLFFLPTTNNPTAAWLLWGGLLTITAVLTVLPWLPHRHPEPPRVNVLPDACTGCTRCAIDCPYNAIDMIERPDDDPTPYKYLAIPHPDLCVSCGICIGSCADDAITLGETPPQKLWHTVSARIAYARERAPHDDVEIVFTCERFAHHTAAPYLDRQVDEVVATHDTIEVIALPCAGAIPPNLLIHAIDEGAAEVRVIGCPPDDCAHRSGNLIAEQRLTRERAPKLKQAYANVPISAVWLPPDQFDDGLAEDVNAAETNWLETRRIFDMLTWHNFLPAFGLLALVLVVQILFSDLSFRPLAAETAQAQVIVSDVGAPLGSYPALLAWPAHGRVWQLTLTVDGETVWSESYPFTALIDSQALPAFGELPLPVTAEQVTLTLTDPGSGTVYTLSNQAVELAPGRILRLTYDPYAAVGVCRPQGCPR